MQRPWIPGEVLPEGLWKVIGEPVLVDDTPGAQRWHCPWVVTDEEPGDDGVGIGFVTGIAT